MPTNRRPRNRVRRGAVLTREQLEALAGGMDFFGDFDGEDRQAAWRQVADTIVAAHVAEFPGTRPRDWWDFDAPERRQRMGGVGLGGIDDLDPELHPSLRKLWYGVPSTWGDVDPDDPPLFESQATYLKRLGLFLPEEAERLTPEDFQPDEGPGPNLDREERRALVESMLGGRASGANDRL